MSTHLAIAGKGRNRPPSLLACTACRKKHLRCDAQMPVCGRCLDRGIQCVYIESRRGYKGPRRNSETKESSQRTTPSPTDSGSGSGSGSMEQSQDGFFSSTPAIQNAVLEYNVRYSEAVLAPPLAAGFDDSLTSVAL